MSKLFAIHKVMQVLDNGNLTTAHQIARVTDYSPQHVNRVLKKLYAQGRVAYCIVPHHGRAKNKRKWCSLRYVQNWNTVYAFETPEYTQMEMAI